MRRSRLVLSSLALAGAAGLGIGTAGAASATSGGYLYPGWDAQISTWVFSPTTLCLNNVSPYSGSAKVVSYGGAGSAYEYMYTAPYGRSCISRWWGGVPVKVYNVSSATMTYTSQ